MTKQELKRYAQMEAELKRIDDALFELRAKIEKPVVIMYSNNPSKSRGKGRGKDITGTLDKIIELERFYSEKHDALIDERIRIEKAIYSLDDYVEQNIIVLRYIKGLSWEEIAEKIGIPASTVRSGMHYRALEKMMKYSEKNA